MWMDGIYMYYTSTVDYTVVQVQYNNMYNMTILMYSIATMYLYDVTIKYMQYYTIVFIVGDSYSNT